MKRLLFIIGMFLAISGVYAKETNFNEVALNFKNTPALEENIILTEIKPTATYAITENKIVVSYTVEGASFETIFTYENGMISYQFSGSKIEETAPTKAAINDAWIGHLVYSVALAKGETKANFKKWLEQIDEEEILSKYGITYTEAEYQANTAISSFTYTGYETFKLNIGTFNLEGKINSSTGSENIQKGKYTFTRHDESMIRLDISNLSLKENAKYSYYLGTTTTEPNDSDYLLLTEKNSALSAEVDKVYELNSKNFYLWVKEEVKDDKNVTIQTNIITKAYKMERLPQYDLTKRISMYPSDKYSTMILNEINSMNRKINYTYKIGIVSDQNILREIKNGNKKGLSDLLDYAKKNTGITGKFISKETKDMLKNVDVKQGTYYFVYAEVDNEDGKYYPIEDINLFMGYNTASGKDLIHYLDANFVWKLDEEIDNDPVTGVVENPKTNTVTLSLISFAIIGTISCICIFKKKDVLKKI